MKARWIIFVAAAAVLWGGCGKKEKEVTDLQRKQAAYLVTEADFAMTMRDYPRAESAMVQVVELAPDNGTYWITLGSARKRSGNTSGAKEAYQSALKAFEAQAKKTPTDADPVLRQVYVLALLGRVDDAKALTEKLRTRFPDNRNVRIFVEEKQLDQMMADPVYKDTKLIG